MKSGQSSGHSLTMQFVRSTRLLGCLFVDLLRHPSGTPALARKIANLLAEEHFHLNSPLKRIDEDLLRVIYSDPVVVPPTSHMRSGNQNVQGIIFLASLAKALHAREAFEIGTYNGLTAWSLAENTPQATVNTLDLPSTAPTLLSLDPHAGDSANRKAWEHLAYEELPSIGKVEQHWGDSASFDFEPWYGRIDLVYIDGAHSEPYVESDTANALAMVSDHGAVVWDDYRWSIRGVRTVLDRRSDIEIRTVPGTRLAVYLTPGALQRLDRTFRHGR
jgi:hypothetical protein